MGHNSSEIGVIGENDAVLAFRALGMRVVAVKTPRQAQEAVFQMVSSGVPVILVTESLAKQIPETIQRYENDPSVSLIPIPGGSASCGYGMERLHARVERAVGANILLNNTEE